MSKNIKKSENKSIKGQFNTSNVKMKRCILRLRRNSEESFKKLLCNIYHNNSTSSKKHAIPSIESTKLYNSPLDQKEHPTTSQVNSIEINKSKLKRYKMKISLGEIRYLKNTKYISEAPMKSKIQKLDRSYIFPKVECKPKLRYESERKSGVLTNITNKEILLEGEAANTVQDVYEFVPENITSERLDATFAAVQKIIKEGKAVVAKHKRNLPIKTVRMKSTGQLLKGIKRNLIRSKQNALIGHKDLEKKMQDTCNDSIETECDNTFDEVRNLPPDLVKIDCMENTLLKNHLYNFTTKSISSDGNNVGKEDLLIHNSSQDFCEPSIAQETAASKNPLKTIKILDVTTLPNRSTVVPFSNKLQNISSNESSKLRVTKMKNLQRDDIGLDIMSASYLDFLAKLQGEKGAKDEEYFQSAIEIAQSPTMIENSQTSRTVDKESSNKSDEEFINNSIFPDVNDTPYFDHMTKRKTYSRLKSRAKMPHFFILLSDNEAENIENKEKTDNIHHETDKQESLKRNENLENSAQHNVDEGQCSHSGKIIKDIKGKENMVQIYSKPEMKRKQEDRIEKDKVENKTNCKRIKLNKKKENFKSENIAVKEKLRNKARLLRF